VVLDLFRRLKQAAHQGKAEAISVLMRAHIGSQPLTGSALLKL